MIFDTDVLIWLEHGHPKALALLEGDTEPCISLQTYMEFLQGARSLSELKWMKEFIHEYRIQILPLTENVGARASYLIESYALSHGLRVGDAIIAATAIEQNLPLATSNSKHFKPIRELQIKHFHS